MPVLPLRRPAALVRAVMAAGLLPGALALGLLVGLAGEARAAQDTPLEVEASYALDLLANVRGGVERGAVGLGSLDVTGRVDLERLLGWSGASLFVYGLATHGAEPSELTGDAQVVSNIEAPDGVRLYEAWVQKNLDGPHLSLLVGLYDVNSEFDVIERAGVFLNSSFGIGAEFGTSGVNGPSVFPVTSLGARAQWHPTHQVYAQAAVLDGVPGDPEDPAAAAVHLAAREGVLWTAEVGFLRHADPATRGGHPQLGRDHVHEGIPWRVAAGVWQYTRAAERVDGAGSVRGRPGAYVLAEVRPALEGAGGGRPLGVFARVGVADGRTNRFAAYTGAGVTYEGPLPGRPDDLVGLGVASAHNGRPYERAVRRAGEPVSSSETTVELTYRLSLGPHVEVQPDVQWVVDPDTRPGRGSALVVGLRVVAGF